MVDREFLWHTVMAEGRVEVYKGRQSGLLTKVFLKEQEEGAQSDGLCVLAFWDPFRLVEGTQSGEPTSSHW